MGRSPQKAIREERDEKVRAVLRSSNKWIGPTEIATIIGEPWCCHSNLYGKPGQIVPILRRIGAASSNGKYKLPKEPK